jgi:hypothetical protein
MEIELLYPVSARAQDEHGFDVTAFGFRSGKFEIRDATDRDYPMLIEFRSGVASHPVQRYRFDPDNGQVYRPVGTVRNAVKTGELTRAYDSQLSFNDLFRNLQSTHVSAARSGKVVLPEFSERLTFVVSRYPFESHQLRNVRQDDLAKHLEEARAMLAGYVVIGGVIWQPCDEPTFKVARGNEAWHVGLGLHNYYSQDWQTFYFSLDEFEMAAQWIDVLDAEVRQRPRATATVAMEAPEYQVVTRGGVEDMRQLVKNVLEKLVRVSLADQTPDIIAEYARLKRFLLTPSADIDDEAVDGIVEAVDRMCTADENDDIVYDPRPQTRQREYRLAQLRRGIDLHIRRWHDRPVHVITVRSTRKPG